MAKILTKDNFKIYYSFINKSKLNIKPTIVFVHGLTVNWTCFKDEISFFKKKGYPIVYYDQRGHGKSDVPENIDDYHLESMAGDLNQILTTEKINECILVGHSMGGMVSTLFTLNYPDKVSKLVLISSSFRQPKFSSNLKYFRKHKQLLRIFLNEMTKHTYVKKRFGHIKEFDISKIKSTSDTRMLFDLLAHTPLHSFFAIANLIFKYDIEKRLSQINNPTLVIGCRNDQFFPPEMEKELADKIPNSKYVLEEGTHSITIKRPRAIASQICSFIE